MLYVKYCFSFTPTDLSLPQLFVRTDDESEWITVDSESGFALSYDQFVGGDVNIFQK